MIDRALAVAGLGLAVISPVLSAIFPVINKKLAWAGFIIGLLVLGVAAGIALFPEGSAQTSAATINNKSEGGNCSFPGGTNSGTVSCGNTTNNITKEPKVFRGWLEPANEPAEPHACQSMLSMMKGANHSSAPPITVLFAKIAMISDTFGKSTILQIDGCPVMSMQRGPNGIMIDASVSNYNGAIIGTIHNNEYDIQNDANLVVQPPSGDDSTLVVHDKDGDELLYVRYLNARAIRIRGTFACPLHKMDRVTITDEQIVQIPWMRGGCYGDDRVGIDLQFRHK